MTEQTDRNFDDQLPTGFGKANYSNARYETWRLKEDSTLILGILPPLKSLLKSNSLFEFWVNHWGWAGQNGDPSKKPFQRPFLCLQEKDYGMIIKECPVCNLRKKFSDRVEAIRVRGKEQGKDDPACNKDAARELEWLRVHGVDSKCRLYAYNKSGQVGVLEIPYSLAKDLREKLKNLVNRRYPGTDKPVNPTGRVGVIFEFSRTGKGFQSKYKVEPHMITKTLEGQEVEVLDFYRIPDETLALAQSTLPDLSELRDRNRITVEQAEALVKATREGSGSVEPAIVDKILGVKQAVQEAGHFEPLDNNPVADTEPVTTPVVSEENTFANNTPPTKEEVKKAVADFKAETKGVPPKSETPSTITPREAVVAPKPAPVASNDDFDSLFSDKLPF